MSIKDTREWVAAVMRGRTVGDHPCDDESAVDAAEGERRIHQLVEALQSTPPEEFIGLSFVVPGVRVREELARTRELMKVSHERLTTFLQRESNYTLLNLKVSLESRMRALDFMLEHVNDAANYVLTDEEIVTLSGSMVDLSALDAYEAQKNTFPMAPVKED